MNSFFEELNKIASVADEGEPMNPDAQVKSTKGEVAEKQAKNVEEKEEQEKKDEERDKEASSTEEDDMMEQIASALPEYGALAVLIEHCTSDADPELHKLASDRLALAFESAEGYNEVITKTASEIYSDEENLQNLYTEAGVNQVMEQLAYFLEDESLEKQADEEGSFLNKVREKTTNFFNAANDFVKAKTGIAELEGELAQAQNDLDKARTLANMEVQTDGAVQPGTTAMFNSADEAVDGATSALRNRKLATGLGAAGLAAGALYGGKKLYDATHPVQEDPQMVEQVASEEEEETEKLSSLLSGNECNDTLKKGNEFELYGGQEKMSKLVDNFLKIAGASALISIANDENQSMELRKEASDTFDHIASLSQKEIGPAFIKIAQELYTEDQLHEVVAGHHNEELFHKVAFFTDTVNSMDAAELEKTAGAGGVAAKGVAGELTNAKEQIQATVEEEKRKAEGQGREYVGDTATSGKVGGGLVGGTEGYNVINNPQKYDVDKTAAALEEAFLLKRAAEENYAKANAFIQEWAPRVYGQ